MKYIRFLLLSDGLGRLARSRGVRIAGRPELRWRTDRLILVFNIPGREFNEPAPRCTASDPWDGE